jgi:DMSO/TMAO reductase YedYZ molybdopterin-dependent catalytic subunit
VSNRGPLALDVLNTRSDVPKRFSALAGATAAGVALAVGELLAALIAPESAPLVSVGGVIIDHVPEGGKDLAIQLFGTNDKLALQVGTIIILLGIAAVLGILAARRLWFGIAGLSVFAAVGITAAVSRTGANGTWAIPSLLGCAAAIFTLWYLLQYARSVVQPTPTEEGGPVTTERRRELAYFSLRRRRFLSIAGFTIGGSAILGFLGRYLGEGSAVNSARNALVLPTPSGTRAVAPPAAGIADLGYVTSNDDFYRIDTAIVVPRVTPDDWSLRIHGRVANEFTINFNELLQRPMIERYVTLTCVSNEVGGNLIGNAKWLGVPVRDLLEQARPDPGADQVVSRSVDGFTAGTPTAVLLDGRDAMIAIAMNGEPLPVEHGFPARMVVPGLYGYVSATKWLAELELTTFADFDAYWVPRGWSQQAPIKTESRIDRPGDGSSVSPGPVTVAGVAWAQHRGISKVEVQVDNGPWQPAELAAVVSIDTWRLWSYTWQASKGSHTLRVRATDNAGEVQTSTVAPPPPNGASGYHTITVAVS